MKRIFAFVILFFIQTCGSVFAQDPHQTTTNFDYNCLNATASTDDIISKNLSTGTANINIPFYNYSVEGIDVNVSMTYNTHGIKVDRVASCVGLGWELNIGGNIVRQINGYADEFGFWTNGNQYQDYAPDFFYATFGGRQIKFMFSKTGTLLTIPQNDQIKIQRLSNGATFTNSVASAPNISFIITDEAGNQFYYSGVPNSVSRPPLPDNTRDYFRLDKILSYEGKTITYEYNQYSGTVAVHDNQLFREYINKDGELYEFTSYLFHDPFSVKAIHYPNNIDVDFTYDNNSRMDYNGDHRLTQIKVVERTVNGNVTPESYSYNFNQSYFLSPASEFTAVNLSNYTLESQSEVSLSGASAASTDEYRFRLKLNSVDLVGFDGSINRYYTFNYSPVPLPRRIWGGKDMYGYGTSATPMQGYINNIGCQYNLSIPLHNLAPGSNYASIGMDNSICSNVEYIKASILTGMTNSHSGNYKFDYVSSSSATGTFVQVGGLSLSKITSFDGIAPVNNAISSYVYSNAGTLCGEGNVNYTCAMWKQSISYSDYQNEYGVPYFLLCGTGVTEDYNELTFNMFSNSANVVNTDLDGTNFVFQNVSETLQNNAGTQVSKKTYAFSGLIFMNGGTGEINNLVPNITSNDPNFNQNYAVPPYANKQYVRSWGVGLPLNISNYDASNNILSSTDYTYNINSVCLSTPDFQCHSYLAKSYTQCGFLGAFACINMVYEDIYYPFTGSTVLANVVNRKYYNNSNYIQSTTSYAYDMHKNLVQKSYNDSKNEVINENFHYNIWLGTYYGAAITKLINDNVVRLIYTDKWKVISGTNYLIGASSTTGLSINNGNIIRPNFFYTQSAPITSPTPYIVDEDIATMSSGTNYPAPVTNFTPTKIASRYDLYGNLLEMNDNLSVYGGKYSSNIVDYENGNIIAKIKNSSYDQVAYCGFESNYVSGTDSKKGNFDFNLAGVSNAHSLLGRYSYFLSNANSQGLWSTGNLIVSNAYNVSFWALAGASVSANDGGNGSVNFTSSSIYTNPNNGEQWTLYKGTFIAAGAGIGIWGNGYIDELKIYPVNATMTTHTYLPLVGKVAEVDENDRITTYEYDGFGNRTVVRDQNGNILFNTKTVVQGVDN